MSGATSISGPLSEAELDQLSDFLEGLGNPEALSLEGMDGLFSALVAGPQTVLPSEYLPVIWGGDLLDEDAFPSIEAANATLSLILRHWNSIITELETDAIHLPVIMEVPTGEVPGREWARGFMLGVDFDRPGWNELFQSDDEGQLIVIPIVAGEVDPEWPHEPVTDEKSMELLAYMAAGLGRSYRHFASRRREPMQSAATPTDSPRRAAPKVGRNEPCPCGSGKKFKRCCGNSPPPAR